MPENINLRTKQPRMMACRLCGEPVYAGDQGVCEGGWWYCSMKCHYEDLDDMCGEYEPDEDLFRGGER